MNGLLGARLPKWLVASIACILPALAFVSIRAGLFASCRDDGTPITETLFTWAAMPGFNVDAAFYFDEITAVMCLIVTGIGTLIHVYSIGYMAHDAGFARYFAYLNLFLFFMLMLVLGKNLVVVFVGWEGVGLASYLLIGFWFKDRAKTAAGLKAFVVNRVGDTGFVLAAFLLFGLVGSFDFQVINTDSSRAHAAIGASAVAARRDWAAAVAGRLRQVGADPVACLAAGRDGRPHAGVGADPRGDDGHRRRLPDRAHAGLLSSHARSP